MKLEQVGPQNWKMIANDWLGEQRSDVQCLHRWQKVLPLSRLVPK